MIRTLSHTLRRLVVDTKASHGCTLVDVTGKSYLDLNANIASLVLGYNHPDLRAPARHMTAQRSALNIFPTLEFDRHLTSLWPRVNPYGRDHDAFLFLASSGSEAVESALKLLLRRRPGTKALSFNGGFHGRTCGALGLTRSNPSHIDGFPQVVTVGTDFPLSPDDEPRCLAQFEQVLARQDIGAVFVEPVQSEGGDRHASPEFFRLVRETCTRYDVAFAVDEVQTAMGFGRTWAHQNWGLDTPPDVVIFSKKMQVAGFFAKPELEPVASAAYGYNSTWGGDVQRAEMLARILDVVEKDSLYSKSVRCGDTLFSALRGFPGVRRVRHEGSFGAFDVDGRDDVVKRLQSAGVIVATCGTGDSIRLRAPLTLSDSDVAHGLRIFEHVLTNRG